MLRAQFHVSARFGPTSKLLLASPGDGLVAILEVRVYCLWGLPWWEKTLKALDGRGVGYSCSRNAWRECGLSHH